MARVQFFDEDPPFFEIVDENLSPKPVRVVVQLIDRRNCGGKSDLLAKAIGWKKNISIQVFDATVGLGRDLSHLLSLGCEVSGCERHPDLYRAVQKAIPRAKIVHGESSQVLDEMGLWPPNERPEVVYLDPMFPEKTKTARSAKESYLLQLLHGPSLGDVDSEIHFLSSALKAATNRVVVKRPTHAPDFGNRKADFTFRGKAVRFDVYLVSRRR